MQRRHNSAVGTATLPMDIEFTSCHISFLYFWFPLYDLSDSGNKDTNNFRIKCIKSYKSHFHKACGHIFDWQTQGE